MTSCYFIGGPLDDTHQEVADGVSVVRVPETTFVWTDTFSAWATKDDIWQRVWTYRRHASTPDCFVLDGPGHE